MNKLAVPVILRFLILAELFVAGFFLLGGCGARSDDASKIDMSSTATISSEYTGSTNSSSKPTGTPTPTPTPVFVTSGDDVSKIGHAATLEYTLDGIYYINLENVLFFPDSQYSSLFAYLDYDQYADLTFSNDGSCVAMIPISDSRGLGKLFYCDGTKAVKIADDVNSYIMSDDGSTLMYLTGFYNHGIGGSLYLYDQETNESTLVSEGAGLLYALSPSGKALAYTTFRVPNDPDSLICHYLVRGEVPQTLGEGMFPVALSDDADTIYTVQIAHDGGYFSIYVGGEKIQLFTDTDADFHAGCMVFNKDCTQVVFSSREKTYLYIAGNQAIQVFEESITSIGQSAVGRTFSDGARNEATASFSGTKNLCNVFFQIDKKQEDYKEDQVATIISFDELLHVTSKQVTLNSDDTENNSLISPNVGIEDTIRYSRENAPDYLYYLEIDENLPIYPEYDSSDEIPYGDYYRVLYRVEDTEGAVPVKIADLVYEVRVGEFGVIYKQYSGPSDGSYAYLDIVKVYHSADGENFEFVTDQHMWLSVALGG